MKLTKSETSRFFSQPPAGLCGVLIYGADAMRVALKRQEVIAALLGPNGDAEMRLRRVSGSDVRADPAVVQDGLKAQGFFPGPRVLFVEDLTDAQATPTLAALEAWHPGDASLIVTAGALRSGSKLRKAFEAHPKAYAVGIYDDPPTRPEIDAELTAVGLIHVTADARKDIDALAQSLDPGDFRQTLEKLSLYKIDDDTPLTSEDVQACGPATVEMALDDLLNAVAEGRVSNIGPLMIRLENQGIGPVTLSIGATRHFRTLYAAACHDKGAAAGLSRAKPPVFGPRRDRMVRQISRWGGAKLETALTLLTETDLVLRSRTLTPQLALVERALIRLAYMGQR